LDSLALKNRRNGRARVCEFFQQLSRSGLGELVLFVEIEDFETFLHRYEEASPGGNRESKPEIGDLRSEIEGSSERERNAKTKQVKQRMPPRLYSTRVCNFKPLIKNNPAYEITYIPLVFAVSSFKNKNKKSGDVEAIVETYKLGTQFSNREEERFEFLKKSWICREV